MDTVLWQTLAGTRGGPNRARVLRALDDQPRNANRLADDLDLAYNTVRHRVATPTTGSSISRASVHATTGRRSNRYSHRWTTDMVPIRQPTADGIEEAE